MRVGYFDCVGGASGDMLLGALADAGASPAAIQDAIANLNLPDCEVRFERAARGGLSAMLAMVRTSRLETPRRLPDLEAVLSASSLPAALKAQAEKVLRQLARVEAEIHGVPVESVHLHELGGDDTLADIVGVLAGIQHLGLEAIYVSPLPLARGWTVSAHGPLPLPAPATLALLEGVPIRWAEVQAELVTPTGAALLTAVASGFGAFPPMTLRRVGSGAGHKEFGFPNILRLWVGDAELTTDGVQLERLTVLETNIDDQNPQVYDYVAGRLFAAGALDVALTPMQMKKSRPAVMLTVLCRPDQADSLLSILFAETTTLGVRRHDVERLSLPRTSETVATPFGPIRVKVTWWDGRRRAVPEYDDCRQVAERQGVPLGAVMAAAKTAAE